MKKVALCGLLVLMVFLIGIGCGPSELEKQNAATEAKNAATEAKKAETAAKEAQTAYLKAQTEQTKAEAIRLKNEATAKKEEAARLKAEAELEKEKNEGKRVEATAKANEGVLKLAEASRASSESVFKKTMLIGFVLLAFFTSLGLWYGQKSKRVEEDTRKKMQVQVDWEIKRYQQHSAKMLMDAQRLFGQQVVVAQLACLTATNPEKVGTFLNALVSNNALPQGSESFAHAIMAALPNVSAPKGSLPLPEEDKNKSEKKFPDAPRKRNLSDQFDM